jgi:hypothetical protein
VQVTAQWHPYTALPHARQLLVIVGTQDALVGAVGRAGPPGPSQLAAEAGRELAGTCGTRLVAKLRSAAAARGLQPFPPLRFDS